ncbi:MAG TPA: type II toxin-antitoxin system VapC family toxin [Rhodothermales bacterium]|nr:type II toxin-antitoxin system VapC family toxin [Rhodothermales bacterium]
MIVVDNDVISYFWLENERAAKARRARRRDASWVAPYLWRNEFRNVLATYIKAGILRYGDAVRICGRAERQMRNREYSVPAAEVLKLVEKTGHSAYDCEYVALAQALGVPLVTGDKKLPVLFPETAVLLEDFAS